MKLARRITLSLALAGSAALVTTISAVSLVACAGTVENPQTTASAVTKAPVGANTHGMVKVMGDALGEVALRPEQRSEIEKLAQDAEARHAPMADGRKELMLAFADQVEKGSIDKSLLQPKIDRIASELESTRTDDRAALTRLHVILDSQQRNAFVDALEKQLKAKHGEQDHHLAGLVKMKQLADDLKLTDAQRTELHEVMREGFHDAMKTEGVGVTPSEFHPKTHHGPPMMGRHEGKKALEAFRTDAFDLDKVAPPHDMKAMAAFGTRRASAVAEKVLPILTPEQRKIAADKLRAMANQNPTALGL